MPAVIRETVQLLEEARASGADERILDLAWPLAGRSAFGVPRHRGLRTP